MSTFLNRILSKVEIQTQMEGLCHNFVIVNSGKLLK